MNFAGYPFQSLLNRKISHIALIVVCALLLRLLGIDYGLPYTLFIDEYHEVMRALQLGTGSFNTGRTGKGGLYLILFVEYGVYFCFEMLMGRVSSARDFAVEFVRDPTSFYLMGRITVASVSAAGVYALYLLCKQAFSPRAGIFAAILIAVNGFHVELSRVVGLDVMLVTLSCFSLFFGLRIITDGGRKNYFYSALFAALATTTKLPGVLLLPALLYCHLHYKAISSHRRLHLIFDRHLAIAIAIFLGVLLLTNPGLFVNFPGYFQLFMPQGETAALSSDGELAEQASHVATVGPNLFYFYATSIRHTLGLPLFVFSLVAVTYGLSRRQPADIALLTFAAINYFAISMTTSSLYYPRYALPVLVILIALSAGLLDLLSRHVRRYGLLVGVSGLLVLGFTPAKEALSNTRMSFKTDNRIIVRDWIVRHVAPGTRILVEGGKVGVKRTAVPLPESLETLQKQYDYWRDIEPRQAIFLSHRIAAHNGGGFELEFLTPDAVASLEDYLASGVVIFVIQPDTIIANTRYKPAGANLIHQLRTDNRVRRLASIPGIAHPRFSASIEVYAVSTYQDLPNLIPQSR